MDDVGNALSASFSSNLFDEDSPPSGLTAACSADGILFLNRNDCLEPPSELKLELVVIIVVVVRNRVRGRGKGLGSKEVRTIVDFFIIGAGINVMRVNVTGATGAGAVLVSREKPSSAVRRTNANPEEDH